MAERRLRLWRTEPPRRHRLAFLVLRRSRVSRVSGEIGLKGNRYSTTVRYFGVCGMFNYWREPLRYFIGRVRAKHEPFVKAWASLDWAGLASGEEDDIVGAKDETKREHRAA